MMKLIGLASPVVVIAYGLAYAGGLVAQVNAAIVASDLVAIAHTIGGLVAR